MRPPHVLFLANAAPEAGLGHVMRSTALASALADRGWEVEATGLGRGRPFEVDGISWAASAGDGTPSQGRHDVVVVDTYEPGPWETLDRAGTSLRVGFSDGAAPAGKTEMLIAPALDPESPGLPPTALTGPRFACLRREYWDTHDRQIAPEVTGVLITMGFGASDILGTVALETANALPSAEIALISGEDVGRKPAGVSLLAPGNSLFERLSHADIVVCAGGQTMLEAAATGAPVVVIETADNQAAQIEMLVLEGAAVSTAPEQLAEAIRDLSDSARRGALSTRARQVIDGRGAIRVAAAVEDQWRDTDAGALRAKG
jgi:UDP-2,4-diacetamido-2,4,6-trideoxy-beta-L-altropyranose hydrolase